MTMDMVTAYGFSVRDFGNRGRVLLSLASKRRLRISLRVGRASKKHHTVGELCLDFADIRCFEIEFIVRRCFWCKWQRGGPSFLWA